MRTRFFTNLITQAFVVLNFAFVSSVGAQDLVQSTFSTAGYTSLIKIPLESGELELLESTRSSTFAVSLPVSTSTSCQATTILEPARILVECKGRLFNKLKPKQISDSTIADRIRFGNSENSSKIIIDTKVETLVVFAPGSGQGSQIDFDNNASVFVFGRKSKSTSDSISTESSSETSPAVVKKLETSTAPGPVFTPHPRPAILFGETELSSLLFSRASQDASAAIRITLLAGRKAQLIKESNLKYLLKVSSARISSPIFTMPQHAPEGFAPFVQALAREVIVPDAPVDLEVAIELSVPAELKLKQNAGEIEVYTAK